MNYQPYLISKYATGLDKELQPWLLPNDAFVELLDGYVYRGVTTKRDGYSGFANGSNSTYTESRMVHNVTNSYTVTGVIDGANQTYTIQASPPIIAGSLTITGSNPVQVVTDDGVGNLTGDGTGTVNYVTGAISVIFTAPPAVASTITVAYGNFAVGNGTAGVYTNTLTNVPLRRGSIVITAGAQSALDNGSGGFVTTPAGGSGTVNYTTGAISITFNAAVTVGTPITISSDYHQGLPVMGVMSFYPTNNVRQLIVADTKYVNRYNPTTDRFDDISSATAYNGTATDFWSWVNYANATSVPRLLFSNGVVGDVIQQYDGTTITAYAPTFPIGVTSLNARQMFVVKDRLVLFQTIESGTLFPRRIRISGTGAECDNFDRTTATGAGFIDIPDNTWFFGAAFNRDDVLFFTEAATWMLKYTGNDVKPFILERLDASRGSAAAFSVISYLNRTIAASPRGLIISDGYQVERMDNNIPDFCFNEIKADQFLRCFSGFLDEDRDVYMIYPSQGEIRPPLLTNGESDRILVINFEEDNYAVYKIPLSCMGNFQNSINILWSDLTADAGYTSWDALAVKYGNWNAFPFSKGAPIAIGGGHKGEVWKLNDTETEDNPQRIRNMTVINADTIRVTTDWNNYEVGDYIFFKDVQGMTQVNNKQGFIKEIITPWNVFDVDIQTTNFTAYTGGGTASKTIPFVALSKKLNPFVEMDKKIRCGWIYFYVSVTNTLLKDGSGNQEPAFLEIDVFRNDINNRTKIDADEKVTYKVDCSNLPGETGSKQWVKIWINQTSKFLQFKMRNNQAGAKIQVHAMMPGFQPVGRLV